MSYYWMLVLVYTIFIPAVIALIRLRSINVIYYPFIILLWTGSANEVISYFTAKYFRNSAPNTNIYGLLEVLIILWQFKRWNRVDQYKKIITFPAVLLCISWIIENFATDSFLNYNEYFPILGSVFIVILSIVNINKILARDRKGLLKNPVFIICICFIIFYAYDASIEILWRYGLKVNDELSVEIYNLLIYINLLVYIFYSYAILCMRRKLPFTMLS